MKTWPAPEGLRDDQCLFSWQPLPAECTWQSHGWSNPCPLAPHVVGTQPLKKAPSEMDIVHWWMDGLPVLNC